LLSRNYDDTQTLEVGGAAVRLGKAAASKVWVEAAS